MRLLELTVRSVMTITREGRVTRVVIIVDYLSPLTNEWLRFDRAMVDHATRKQ